MGLILSGFAGRAWALLETIPPLWLAIALLGASTAFLWHNASQWKERAGACATQRVVDLNKYTAAQAAATRIATEAKQAEEARTAQLKKDADNARTLAFDEGRRSADAYYAAHRVRREAVVSVSSSADLPETSALAGKPDDTTSADLVAISKADFDGCTANTLDLRNAYGWAQKWHLSLGSPSSQELR